MMRTRLQQTALRSAIVAATLVLLYGAIEGLVRVVLDNGMHFNLEMWKYARDIKQRSANPLIGHEHRPHARSFLMGAEVATNAEGHRDRDVPVARQPGVGRIVMVGDSFIEGWGVRADETISKRLEVLFDRGGTRVEVMNTGVGNYNTTMDVEAFLTRDAKYNPDVVVLNYVVNDAEPVPAYTSTSWLARHSEAAVFIEGAADSLRRIAQPAQQWDQYYLGLYDTPGWDASKAAIERLAVHCRTHQIVMVVVSWPELHDVRHYRLGRVTDLVRGVAGTEHVMFVDLLEAVKDQEPSTLWVTPPDPHPNGKANALFADHLYPVLRDVLKKIGAG